MRVLFVSSGNAKGGISSLVKNQAISLNNLGIEIEFFTIKGRGLQSYFRHIFILRKYYKKNNFDLVHSHYSYSSFVAALAGIRPLIVSLMGSDVMANGKFKSAIKWFNRLFWSATIVKSGEMKISSGVTNAIIIPNGVDIEIFKPILKSEAIKALNWDPNKRHILFAANPGRYEKNFKLAQVALKYQSENDLELHVLDKVPPFQVPLLMNASEIVILTSLWEGSPNVIKEAMACNCPIVSTDVGDVREIIENIDGCYISNFDATELSEKIRLALEFARFYKKNNGRNRIIELGLDSKSIAKRIFDVYQGILSI